MIFRIKEIFLLIFLILLQSCSGGRIGNFLELSFANLDTINKEENKKNVLDNKKISNSAKEEINKENVKKIKKEEKSRKKDTLNDKKSLNSYKKSDKIQKNKILKNPPNKRSNDLHSYRIIFILKDVDPKDPIQKFSTILRNSEVNFEIEKVERLFDSKNKIIKKN